MRVLLLLSIMAVSVFGWGAPRNWSGVLDTAQTYAVYDTIKFTKAFPLSELEDIRVILKAQDTVTEGFLDDSIGIQWGYQTFTYCLNSSGDKDSCFDQLIVLDTLDSLAQVSFGAAMGSSGSDGTITRSTRIADTLGCAGFATQSKWFLPEWDTMIRFWVKGIGKHRRAAGTPCYIDVQRRQYINVRNK